MLYYKSPIGLLQLEGTAESLVSLSFAEGKGDCSGNEYLCYCFEQIDEYFKGIRQVFKINLAMEGTNFQKRVWNELIKIPYGMTKSYLEVTKSIGDLKAIRAVANANGRNNIPIIIPCHRVIGNDGSLVGYAGGIWRKKWLLDHEKKYFRGEKQLEIMF
jgi:methylated-DNA-[protein]-cysteine S-methyltransferase